MADIVENVITVTPTTFTLPVYRKTGDLFIKVYDTTKMLVVCTTAGSEYILATTFPKVTFAQETIQIEVQTIKDTTASDVTEFGTAYAATEAILSAL